MSARTLLSGMLAVVATAAAVLSFAALDELGRLCGFGALSPLLPVVVDAGAAAGSVAWLSRDGGRARTFGRALALVLLVGSVAGNALSHGLSAYGQAATWWVVVAVSAVPPAVLGAVVHLATLTVQGRTARPEQAVEPTREGAALVRTPAERFPESGTLLGGATEKGFFPEPRETPVVQVVGGDNLDLDSTDGPTVGQEPTVDRVGALIAGGVGRRRLARELGISQYAARTLLAERSTNGNGVVQ